MSEMTHSGMETTSSSAPPRILAPEALSNSLPLWLLGGETADDQRYTTNDQKGCIANRNISLNVLSIGMTMRPAMVISALCLLGPVLLALLPSTGWIVRGDCASLIGLTPWTWLGITEDDDIPAPALYDRAPLGKDRDSTLTAFGLAIDRRDLTRRFAALDGHWDDADFLASYVLQACTWAPIGTRRVLAAGAGYPEETERGGEQRSAKRLIWSNVRQACNRATTLEPDNAFFPALSAAASDYLGDSSATRASLALASRCTVWNDHGQQLERTFQRVLRRDFGYRGAVADIVFTNSLDGVPPIGCLRGLAAGVSRMPFDRGGIESRRGMFRIARLAYNASATYRGVEQAAQLVNRVAWYGPAKEMSQTEARRSLLESLSRTASRVEPLDAGRLEASLREMIAAEDFRSARHLGPSWEGPAMHDSEPENSWWAAMTEPGGAGRNATSYTLAALSVAAGLLACLLVFEGLKRCPQRFRIPQLLAPRPWVQRILVFVGCAGIGVAICAFLLYPPFLRSDVWLGTVALLVVGSTWMVSEIKAATVAHAAGLAQRLACRLLAATSLVVCAGIVWQLGVDARWDHTFRQMRTTGEAARKWAHQHPVAVDPVAGDVWWTGA